jgi:hypothetical protein
MCGWDYETLLADTREAREERERLPPVRIGHKIYHYRDAFTFFGTEVMRDNVCETIWVDLIEKQIRELLASGTNVCVSDTRLQNEISMLRAQNAEFICLWRKPDDLVAFPNEHITETDFLFSVAKGEMETVDNSGPLEQTYIAVDKCI